MCCRYYIERADPTLIQMADVARNSSLLRRIQERDARPLSVEGEVYPGSIAPVIASSRSGHKTCFPMIWGYRLEHRPLLLNARVETASVKPLFALSWKAHRCVIPASWYYEWEHFMRPNGKRESGEKYMIQPSGARITWLSGLYRMEDGLPHFVILTRPPSEELSFIHDRMPLMIREDDIDEWISPDGKPDEIAYRAVTDLCFEKAGT